MRSYIIAILCTLFAVSCSEPSAEVVDYSASIKNDAVVGRTEGVTSIYLSGAIGDSWQVEISNNQAGWCGLDYRCSSQSASGTLSDGVNTIFLYYKTNNSIETREATITVTFGQGESFELVVTQLTENIYDHKYLELPAYDDNDSYLYTTHYTTTTKGEALRNYSICYDTKLKTSLWVAYPLHQVYLGDYDRDDEWAFDPKIPQNYQQDCTDGSYDDNGGSGNSNYNYDRGHQLPSADRKDNAAMNNQTCYMSNITPQTANFNRYLWASIEKQVRSYMCADTLYVVTGAYFDPAQSMRYTKDNNGAKVPVPTNYFKALLRTRAGDSQKSVAECTREELKGICFWLENSNDNGSKIDASMFRSIDEVESMIGFDLFPDATTLDESQCVTSDWGY